MRKDCDSISLQPPSFPIRDELVELETTLWTPVFDVESISTIPHVSSLCGIAGPRLLPV